MDGWMDLRSRSNQVLTTMMITRPESDWPVQMWPYEGKDLRVSFYHG